MSSAKADFLQVFNRLVTADDAQAMLAWLCQCWGMGRYPEERPVSKEIKGV